ncbi:17820_t:CDS:2 [Dentiscutata erythropus]|uniref:Chitin synthase n=1 Tax=Dentiscutata erythropus TaxID=1348616 RepID=A0A9N9F741_9GLOM|nr:17820_t:CDS:2 [Dentiscutata erythropus]
MSSVIKNVSWQKIVVLIVADGLNKINECTLNILSLMGCYQDGIIQKSVRGKSVTAYLFKYTTQLIVNDDFNVQGKYYNIPPVQVIFCLKQKNAKKLNSHSFDRDQHIGGACGEIKVDLGYKYRNLLNPLITSQNFEYKISNILDKPSESVFGYISVLPGAFSAYRYEALLNGPLEKYLKGEYDDSGATKTSIFEANMYLAEDHILSFELVIKKDESWKLKYIKANFYLAFVFLIQSTTSNPITDPFKSYRDNLFEAAHSLYLIIIVIIFICSIGNRLQGTKLIYTLSVPPIDFKNLSNIQETLKNAAFHDIIISVALTFLLYLFLSFIYFEPWHMFSCLVQYLLLVPSYVNILIIYAFCNTHDVSWGTKEDNINTGVLPTEVDQETITIEIYEDEDAAYDNIITQLKNKEHDDKQHQNAVIKKDDYYKLFRKILFFYRYLQMV